MNEIVKLGVILFLITSICAALLGGVNSITTPIIAERKETSKQQMMKELLNEAETFVQASSIEDEVITELYIGVKDKAYVGTVAKIAPAGYGGQIELLVGIDVGGKVKGIKVLSHTETPGLGANAATPEFSNQFMDKSAPLKVVKGTAKEDEISAITGATITSNAVTKGVNIIADYVNKHKNELEQGVTK